MGTTNSHLEGLHSEKLDYSEIISFPDVLCLVCKQNASFRKNSSVQERARGHSSMSEEEKSVRNVNGIDKSSVYRDFSNDDYADVPTYTPPEYGESDNVDELCNTRRE
jgi:hypothetical protein